MATCWPVLGTLRRSSATTTFRHPSSSIPRTITVNIPSPSPATRRPSTTTSTTTSTPRRSLWSWFSWTPRRVLPKAICACSPTNHTGSYVCSLHRNANANANNNNNNGKKKLNTNATTNTRKKEAQGGHFPISDRVRLPKEVLAKSLLQMGPTEAQSAIRSLQRRRQSSSSHRIRGAAFQPRSRSRLSNMAVD